jgi:hypothetical protein
MSDTDESVNVVIDFSHKISLIRFLSNSMAPVRLKLRAEVFPREEAEEIDFDITFAKVKFWFETVVARSVVFCRTNTVATEMVLTKSGKPRLLNHLMMTPYEPTDEHLAVLFQSKLSALSRGTMEFGCVRVEQEEGGLVFTYVGDWHNDLPSMETWFDTKPYYFTEPWWQRDDASTLDIITANADMVNPPAWAYRLDFIENAIRPKHPIDEVVVRGGFNPKIIRGGRDDE